MKRLILGVVVALALTSGTASAQAAWTAPVYGWGSGWCPTCYTYMNIDTPNITTPFNGSIAGWAFGCADGRQIDRIDVYYGTTKADSYISTVSGERWDVVKYFGKNCRTPSTTGWTVGFNTPIPPGTWTMTVVVWTGMVSTKQTGLVIVP
jgi:hypothetical protein